MKNKTNIQASGLLRGGTTRINLWRPMGALVVTLLLALALPQAHANNGIAAGLLKVDVMGSNINTNVTVTPVVLINEFLPVKGDNWTITNIVGGVTNLNTFPVWNTGDYYVQIGETRTDDVAKGVLISSVAENGRYNTNASGVGMLSHPASFVLDYAGGWWCICSHTTNTAGTAGSTKEWNVNVAGAWFPYDRYIAGHARNATRVNGGVNDYITGSPELVYGTTFLDCTPDGSGGCAANGGLFTLDLRSYGINSQTDGILLVNGGKDEGNFALSEAQADGTWLMIVHDISTGTAGNEEQDPIAFVYVPRTDTSVISGKVDGDGNIMMYSGSSPQFTATQMGAGRYKLQMNGYAATNGVLIISAEGNGTYNLDNIVSYQISADGQSFEVQSRDTPNNGLQSPYALIGGVRYPEGAFSFAFIPAPTEVGVVVWPKANLLTAETPNAYYTDPYTNAFTVHLSAKPTADVTISGIVSSDATEGVVCDGLTSLTFTPDNWWMPQTVRVTGVDDVDVDGQKAYTIVLPAATSADSRFNGLNPSDVGALNADNEAGISVSANSLTTSEGGLKAAFQVALNTAPTADVQIGLSASDFTEGDVLPLSLTFTSGDWSTPQTVTVTGLDDTVQDGDVIHAIVTAAATSTDPAYNGVDALDVAVVNLDNDAAGLNITPKGLLTVSEPGTTLNFEVVLPCEPKANVTVSFTSSDTTEGTVSPASRTFTPDNWAQPQSFTLTAVDDLLTDGAVSYTLSGTVTSGDAAYAALTPVLSAQTLDNDPLLTLPSGTLHYGIGWPGMAIDGQATITDSDATDYDTGKLTVTLTVNAQSDDRVEIRHVGTDPGQIGVSGSTVTYGGVGIGTFSGGVGTAPLVVTLNAAANLEAAQALARDITYRSVTNSPLQDPRTVAFTFADGDGGTTTASKQIAVSKLHVSDFQYGKDGGFGVYTGAEDCEIYNGVDESAYYPAGTYSDTANGLVGLQVHIITTNPYSRQVLMRFKDIVGTNPGQIPPNAILVEANLMLYVMNQGDGSPLYRMKTDWDATATSWLTFGSGVDMDGIEAESTYYSQFNTADRSGDTGTGMIEFSVLPDVQAWVNGTNNYGWVLPTFGPSTTANDNTIIAPAEATNLVTRPRLVVKWLPAEGTIKSASFQQGVNGYTGAVDTRVRLITPDTEYSTVNAVFIDAEVTGGMEDPEHVLLRFDNIIGTAIPPYSRIHAAVLDLVCRGGNHVGDGGTFNRMLIPWEATATWNSLVDGISANDVEAVSVPTATAGNDTGNPNAQAGWLTFDMTSDVQLWASGTPNYGWAGLPWPYLGDGWGMYTSDHATVANRPQLRVYYTLTVPRMVSAVVLSPTSVQVNFEGEPGKTCEVWRSPAAAGAGVDWTTKVGEATLDANGNASVVDNSPLASGAYYRAKNK